MDSSFALSSTFTPFHKPNHNLLLFSPRFSLSSKTLLIPSSKSCISSKLSSHFNTNPSNRSNKENPFSKTLKSISKTLVLTFAATLITSKFKEIPVKTETLTPTVEESSFEEQKADNLSEIVDSNPELVEKLWKSVQKRLEIGKDEEALKFVGKLIEAQPNESEWKILKTRLLREMGKFQKANETFEEILGLNPLSFKALFALLMDRCDKGNGVLEYLEECSGWE